MRRIRREYSVRVSATTNRSHPRAGRTCCGLPANLARATDLKHRTPSTADRTLGRGEECRIAVPNITAHSSTSSPTLHYGKAVRGIHTRNRNQTARRALSPPSAQPAIFVRALRHRNVGVHTYKLLLDGRFRPAGPWPVRPARPQTTLDARQTQGGCRSVSEAPHASGIATPPVRTYSPAFSGAEG